MCLTHLNLYFPLLLFSIHTAQYSLFVCSIFYSHLVCLLAHNNNFLAGFTACVNLLVFGLHNIVLLIVFPECLPSLTSGLETVSVDAQERAADKELFERPEERVLFTFRVLQLKDSVLSFLAQLHVNNSHRQMK